MSLKIAFQKPSAQKTLCLGVYEDNRLPSVTQNWDKTLKSFLSTSLKNSKFKGKLNQILSLFTSDGMKIILVGLGKEADQNEKQWQKIGASLTCSLQASPNGEGAIEIHSLKGCDDSH